MSQRLLRLVGYAGAVVLGLAAAVCGAAGLDSAALVALGLGLAALAGSSFLAQRSLGGAVAGAERGLARKLQRSAPPRKAAEPATSRELAALATQVRQLAGVVDSLPSQVVELQRRYDQLVTVEDPMPGFGSWAATAPAVLGMVDHVLSDAHREIVLECGSGSSTIWLAAAFRKRGHGHVVALEHDPGFAEETRRRLAVHGLSAWATVLDTPLVEQTTPDGVTRPWYAIDGAALPERVDILFVDGPPGNTSPLARYPAWPLLGDRMAMDALVVLDDTHRAEERRIRDRWIGEPRGGRALRVARVVGRTTFLQVVPA